ncbi:MAG: hydrogenase maturation protease [Aquificae bacterium]|nr:hydrogenase maturation protease [Aquificota bacterium]
MEKTLILGVGNLLISDEGLGIETINILLENYQFPNNVEIIDGGTQGLELLQYFDDVQNLLIIDAISSKEKKAGSIIKIPKEKINYYLDTKISAHDIGLIDIISALDFTGKLPKNITILGIVPEKLEFEYGLSPKIKENLQNLVNEVINQLLTWKIGEIKHVNERSAYPQ